ncbi:MAG: pentapeptide repeat-containing protein [Candidatus Dormibacteria bacterium]
MAKLSDRASGGAWPRVRYGGALSHTRVDVPAGEVTVEIVSARWDHVDLSGQRFANYAATDSVLESCNFARCTIAGGVLSAIPVVTYRGCNFEGADLRGCAPNFARFERCRFVDIRLDDWHAVNAEFVDCTFSGRLLRVSFSGTPLGFGGERIRRIRSTNEFRGNDFSDAQLIDCSVEGGIDLDANRWPQSDDYVVIRSAHERIAGARAQVGQKPESARRQIVAWLDVYSLGGYALQKDILVRRDELGAAADLLLPD